MEVGNQTTKTLQATEPPKKQTKTMAATALPKHRHSSILSGSIEKMALEIQKMESLKRRKIEKRTGAKTQRQRCHLLCSDYKSSNIAYWWQITLSMAVIVSILTLFAESFALMPAHDPAFPDKMFFDGIEVILCLIFVGELTVRLYCAPLLWYRTKKIKKTNYAAPSSNKPSLADELEEESLDIPFFKGEFCLSSICFFLIFVLFVLSCSTIYYIYILLTHLLLLHRSSCLFLPLPASFFVRLAHMYRLPQLPRFHCCSPHIY